MYHLQFRFVGAFSHSKLFDEEFGIVFVIQAAVELVSIVIEEHYIFAHCQPQAVDRILEL